MAAGLSARGARDFLTVSKHLKAAGEGDLRKEFHKTVRDAAKPLLPKVREAARSRGPKRGGLNSRLAKKPYRVQARTGAKTAGVRIVGSKVDPRINNLGRVAHPVYGRGPAVIQYVPKLKGYFDETLQQSGPAVQADVVKAMDDWVRHLMRGGV
jgi:hypothetical protein